MSRLLRFAAIVACVAALFGCSSSNDDAGSSTTTAGAGGGGGGATGEFATQLSDACSAGQASLDAATADFSTALDDLQSAANRDDYQAAVSELGTAAQGISTALADYKSSLEALDVPGDLSDAFDQLTQALDDQTTVADQLADAPTDTLAAFEDAVAEVQSDAEAARQAQSDAADALGTSACGPSNSTGGGGGGGGGGAGATTTTAA